VNRRLLRAAVITPLLLVASAPGITDMTDADIRAGWLEHAARAQLHRWYQVYERPAGGIDNALDILAEDVVVNSGLGTATGHDEYASRVAQLPATWRNSHVVESSIVEVGDGERLTLTADVTYRNAGMLESGAVRVAGLDYVMEMRKGDATLPLLTRVEIGQREDGETETFADAYAENRLLSLVHYYLALIEDPARDPEPMRELLGPNFSLNFSSGAITSFDDFSAWLAGPGSQVTASTHLIENFSHETLDEDRHYRLSVDFDWSGILPDGTTMVARTRHVWTVINDVTERFARIENVDVEVLEPFRAAD